MTPDFLEFAKVFGLPIAIAVAILVAGAKGYWVFGWVFRDMREDRDHYRDLSEKGTDLADKALDSPAPPRRPRRPRRE